jgi:hypothetical protein
MKAKYRLLRNGFGKYWAKCQVGLGNIGHKLMAGPHDFGATPFRRRVPNAPLERSARSDDTLRGDVG